MPDMATAHRSAVLAFWSQADTMVVKDRGMGKGVGCENEGMKVGLGRFKRVEDVRTKVGALSAEGLGLHFGLITEWPREVK